MKTCDNCKHWYPNQSESKVYRDKIKLEIRHGSLVIVGRSGNEVVLGVDDCSHLLSVLPGLMALMNQVCSGNESLTFGNLNDPPK